MVELIVDTYLKQDYKPRTKDLTTSVYSHPSGAGLCVSIISILFTNSMSLLHAKYGGMASVLTVGLDFSVGTINNSYTLRPRDLWYLESRWPLAVTPKHSEGITRGRRDSKHHRSHWPR